MDKDILKLNLGSGTDYMEGWTNVDISSSNRVDIVIDLSKKFPFENNLVDEIKASDILEHFTKEQGKKFLIECYRVLKPEGKIFIRTHNVFQIFRQFSSDPLVLFHFLYGDTSEGISGSHKYAYTEKSLSLLLKSIGFRLVSIKQSQTNFEVVAIKSKLPNKRLKSGIILQSPDMGGAETYMASLVKEFSKKDKVFTVSNSEEFLSKVSPYSKTRKVSLTMDIIGNYRGLIKTFVLLPYAFFSYIKILRWFKKEKIDVILMSNFTEKLFVTFLSVLFSIPVVWIEYGKLEPVLRRNFNIPKIIYRLASNIPYAVIAPTIFTKESLIRDAHVSLAKIQLIPLGVEVPKNFKHNSVKDAFVIGSVSRLTKEKGQEYLINAMPEIIQNIPTAKLLIIGRGPDENYFKSLVEKLGIGEHVEFTGFVEDINNEYSKMDVFIFPTVWDMEGFGLVIAEAMLRKIPVLASYMEPVTTIIQNEKTGLLFKPGDPLEIAKAVIKFKRNSKLAQEISKNAYDYAIKHYTIEKSSTNIKDVLYEAAIY